MDYIFGQSDKQEEKGKRKEKQLKTQIFVPEKDPNHKQLTPLQRFKLEARKKLQEKHQQEPENEFQQVQQPTPERKSEIKQTESPKSPKKSQSSRLMSPKKVESPRKAMSPVKTKEEAQSKPVKTNSPLKQLKQAQLKVDIRSAKEIKQPMKSDSIELKRSKSIKQIKENKGIKEVARISKPIKAIKEVQKSRSPKLQIEPDYGYEFKIEPQPDVRDLLEIQLGQSERGLKFLEKKFIGDKIGDAQNLVYNAETSQKPKEYLKNAYSNIQPDNEFIKEGVDETVNNALKSINKLIQHPKEKQFSIQKRRAPRHKDDLKELQKLDKVRLIKIKQGQVKHKVGDLRSQLQKEYFMNKHMLNLNPQEIMDANYYSMQHPETQKAQNLIRQINKKRRMQQRHFREMLSHQQAEKERIQQIEKEYEEKLNRERKEKLREFYEQKHLQREEQKEELKKKEDEFKSWIKMYEKEKPLEEKLEEEMVMKFIIPQIQDRHRKLVKIKAEHRPIDIQEINQHDQRYMQLKRDEKIRQKAQLQSKMQNDIINEQQVSRYYKGKYRYLVLESMYEEKNQTDPKEIERSKKERQLAYSDQVKYVNQSLVKKRNEMLEDTRSLIRRVRNHNGSVSVNEDRQNKTIELGGLSERNHLRKDGQHQRRDVETLDTYAEGLKNLQYVKSHIREKLMNGQEKKPKIQLIEIRENKDYLQELREQRQHNSLPHKQKRQRNDSTLRNSSLVNNKGKQSINDVSTANDVESLKARVDNLDERIKRKQVKNKHVRDHSMLDRQIEQQYMESINAKLKLVQELK